MNVPQYVKTFVEEMKDADLSSATQYGPRALKLMLDTLMPYYGSDDVRKLITRVVDELTNRSTKED